MPSLVQPHARILPHCVGTWLCPWGQYKPSLRKWCTVDAVGYRDADPFQLSIYQRRHQTWGGHTNVSSNGKVLSIKLLTGCTHRNRSPNLQKKERRWYGCGWDSGGRYSPQKGVRPIL